ARSVEELSRSAMAARRGALPAHPLLIVGLHTLADPTRAPAGKHTLWAMTHVPSHISSDDGETISARTWGEAKAAFTDRILDEFEAFAPGFRRLVLATHAQSPEDLERANSNLVGGDIGTGSYTLDQQLVFRPLPGWFRYHTPLDGLYISGAATHPGGGVHGAAGSNAARVVLSDLHMGRVAAGVARAASPLRSLLPGGAKRWLED
ncbi:MAG TPA: NAD(P)/FAD-dependent oxidoreductase, partial [Chloroflexota bacterium]|nr:NAD(P)/FAD-dependent oxidoreductase [Chloroflexota bacterium]